MTEKIDLISDAEHKEIEGRIDNLKAWLKEHNGNWFREDELPENCRVSNDEQAQLELYEFCKEQPKSYGCYVKRQNKNSIVVKITTWTGLVLGHGTLGKSYYSNFGDLRYPIHATGVNDIEYHGTFYAGAGDYCTLKAYKDQSEHRKWRQYVRGL